MCESDNKENKDLLHTGNAIRVGEMISLEILQTGQYKHCWTEEYGGMEILYLAGSEKCICFFYTGTHN